MVKPRVLYLVHEFPQISQTYIRSELEAVREECEVKVIGLAEADLAYRDPGPFLRTDDPQAIREAIAEFREAVRLNPGYAMAHANLGHELADKGLLDEAIAAHREAVRLAPDFAPWHNSLATSLGKKRLLDEAIRELREAVRLDPRDAPTRGNLGNAFKEKGLPDEAIAAYREAIRLDPGWACYHHSLGALLLEKGDRDAGISALEQSTRLEPIHDEHFVDLDRAYTAALEASPSDPRILIARAYLLATCPRKELRDAARAVELARRAVELAPAPSDAWSALGVAEYRRENWKEAIAALEKSIELSSDGGGFALFFLAMTRWRPGSEAAARKDYERGLRWMEETGPDDVELQRFRSEAAALLHPHPGRKTDQ